MKQILFPEDVGAHPSRAMLGGKAAALAEMSAAGLPVPPWFVVTPDAFTASLPPDAQNLLTGADAAHIETILADLRPGDGVTANVSRALSRLCPNAEAVAVRSSAVDEDGSQHSFAGQLSSYLFVALNDVPERIADVWRSGYSPRVLAYRREMNLTPAPTPPAVLVQRMVDADAAGVAFSADPVTGRRGIAVVSAVPGIGEALVSGEIDADTWRVDRKSRVIERALTGSDEKEDAADGHDPLKKRTGCLTDQQARAVAGLARRAARYFGCPQDIEWAIQNDQVYLLQARPITGLAALFDPDGGINIWDNSNIAESYGGITTPLTFSFASHIYSEVYRQFCLIMAVPARAVEACQQIFPRMLGLVRGRVYYNLINWYRLLALFPGFRLNQGFMEQMMGVREKIPEEVLADALSLYRVGPIQDALNLLRTISGLLINLYRMPRTIRAFYRRLERALAPSHPPLSDLRPDELCSAYRMLESQLLTRWDAPLINDFFAMLFYGLLQKLTARWCCKKGLEKQSESLQNDLISGQGGMISAEPAQRILEMARMAAKDPALTEALAAADRQTIEKALSGHGQLKNRVDGYMARFGDRCLDELKLESATLHDDPMILYRSVGEFARRIAGGHDAKGIDERAIRRRAERNVARRLSRRPLHRMLYYWVLAQARDRVRDRENLRFERTRLFGRVRRIFVELGQRFHANGILDDPRDIFWLEKNEIFGFIEGTATTTDLKKLAALRREEFGRWQTAEAPADRFETFGMVNHAHTYQASGQPAETVSGDTARGLGCCPGKVRGRVRVIHDPKGARLRQGEILVAERTDPGWVMLFPAAAGLLVQRGSLLSHSAIVAREMGIPAIVSLAGVTTWLSDGDLVEMDGETGVVNRLEDIHADQ
ncbi:PpsAB: phenylphosphate synthase, subunits alpha + beta [Desulfosarcina variabilis str. Montpellier]|uniref:PEP/pyruvate-binding domain-containing protein n=1 Tax=Desulfosarcina variabilis TaxID=2300 RepID=UPI003AFB1C35